MLLHVSFFMKQKQTTVRKLSFLIYFFSQWQNHIAVLIWISGRSKILLFLELSKSRYTNTQNRHRINRITWIHQMVILNIFFALFSYKFEGSNWNFYSQQTTLIWEDKT